MRRRTKSSLLWGAVGLLVFLVASQGYRLLVGPLPTGLLGLTGVGVVVGTTVGVVSYVAESRLATKGRT